MGVRCLLLAVLGRLLRFCQSVVSVIELGDITAIVLRDHKASSRVYFLIAIDSENQVVTNYKRSSELHGLLNLLWRPLIQLSFLVKMFQELDPRDQLIVTFVVASETGFMYGHG